MKKQFLEFMFLWYKKQGDCCPKYKWDQFIVREFEEQERQCAIELTDKLIRAKYIQLVSKSVGECFEISQYGIEMIKKGNLEV